VIIDQIDVEPGESARAAQDGGVWRTVGGA
jgi:hypothetical protein